MLKCPEHDYHQHHALSCITLFLFFFGLCKVRLTLFSFPVCLLSLTSNGRQIDLNGIASVWNVLPCCHPVFFGGGAFFGFLYLEFTVIVGFLWNLLHLLSQKPHVFRLMLRFIAVVQCSSQPHSCSSPSLPTFCSPCSSISLFALALLLAHSFWHRCSSPVLNLQWMPQPRF